MGDKVLVFVVWTLLLHYGVFVDKVCASVQSVEPKAVVCPYVQGPKPEYRPFPSMSPEDIKEGKSNIDFLLDCVKFKLFTKINSNYSDEYSRSGLWPLCRKVLWFGFENFKRNSYRTDAQCNKQFCSQAYVPLQKPCKTKSRDLQVMEDYTRCVLVKHPITKNESYSVEDKLKLADPNFRDACVCAYCDPKGESSIFYLFYENSTWNRGVYYYLRIDNPYNLGKTELQKDFKYTIENQKNSSQNIQVNLYALLNTSKYDGLFYMNTKRATSDCEAGAMEILKKDGPGYEEC